MKRKIIALITSSYLSIGAAFAQSTNQDFMAEPNMVGGKLRGFYLKKIEDRSVAFSRGFRNGDLILSVNGKSITTTEAMGEASKDLFTQKDNEVRIKRGNKEIILNISLATEE